jgi:hypothetical protein
MSEVTPAAMRIFDFKSFVSHQCSAGLPFFFLFARDTDVIGIAFTT